MHMPQMTLYVRLRKDGEKDRFGNETYGYSEPIAVEGCMFAPATAQDLSITRPEGVEYGAKGYGAKIKVGQTRARAIVYTGNKYTMRSNAKHNTLQKALGGGK